MLKLLLLLLLVLSLHATTDFEEAYALYKKDDFKTSLKLFTKLAQEEKDYDAAYILGYMYEHGEGCEVDIEESQKWYKLSSHGYYWQMKPDPSRNTTKESLKLYKTIDKSANDETRETIKQYAQSLYSIKAHGTNYFLPISYRANGEYPRTNGHKAEKVETEFQVSIKYNYGANLFGLNEIYSIGYTQISFWQLYVDSAYFRETNYNPEAFVTLPFTHVDYLKAIRVSFAHQSNGRGGLEERSWNYLSASFYFQTGFLFTELKLWHNVFSLEYNKDLMHYHGYGEVKVILPYKKHIAKFILRNPLSEHRAMELNYSYPLFGSKDLFVYAKGFSGYGESLIDYNHFINKFSIGFSISR